MASKNKEKIELLKKILREEKMKALIASPWRNSV